jgi:ABC-type antimicrobial peptide transport system permease subunit
LIIGYQAITLTIEENKKEIGIYYSIGISKKEFMMISFIEALLMIIIVSLLTCGVTFSFAAIINNTYIGSLFSDYRYDGLANYLTYIYQLSSSLILWGILYLVFVFIIVFIIPTAKLLNKDVYQIIKEN